MAEMQNYEGPGEVQMDSRTLAESSSINTQIRSNSTPVNTMKKGLAGRSKGPVAVTIQVENAVPKAGLEQEFIEKCVKNATVKITHKFGARTYVYSGWIDEVTATNAVDAAAGLSFTVMAGPPLII